MKLVLLLYYGYQYRTMANKLRHKGFKLKEHPGYMKDLDRVRRQYIKLFYKQ